MKMIRNLKVKIEDFMTENEKWDYVKHHDILKELNLFRLSEELIVNGTPTEEELKSESVVQGRFLIFDLDDKEETKEKVRRIIYIFENWITSGECMVYPECFKPSRKLPKNNKTKQVILSWEC